jgi:hypothetical protein
VRFPALGPKCREYAISFLKEPNQWGAKWLPTGFFVEISVLLKRHRENVRFGITFSSNHRTKGSTFKGNFPYANRATYIFFNMPFLHTSSKAAMIFERFRNCWPSRCQNFDDLYLCSQPRSSAPRSYNGAMPTGISRQFFAGEMVDGPVKSDENRIIIPSSAEWDIPVSILWFMEIGGTTR